MNCPECEKIDTKEHSAICEFAEWLIFKSHEDEKYLDRSPESLYFEFVGIDEQKVKAERAAIVEALRGLA